MNPPPRILRGWRKAVAALPQADDSALLALAALCLERLRPAVIAAPGADGDLAAALRGLSAMLAPDCRLETGLAPSGPVDLLIVDLRRPETLPPQMPVAGITIAAGLAGETLDDEGRRAWRGLGDGRAAAILPLAGGIGLVAGGPAPPPALAALFKPMGVERTALLEVLGGTAASRRDARLRDMLERLSLLIAADPNLQPHGHSLARQLAARADAPLDGADPAALEDVIALLDQALAEVEGQVAHSRSAFGALSRPLNPYDIYGWSAVRFANLTARLIIRLSDAVAPSGSRRRQLAAVPLRLVRGVRNRGIRAVISDRIDFALARWRAWRRLGLRAKELVPAAATAGEPPEYDAWLRRHPDDPAGPTAAEIAQGPRISLILPVYKIPHAVLRRTIDSILDQAWPKWQLCLALADHGNAANQHLLEELAATDERVVLTVMPRNLGISGNSNAAFRLADGDFVALIDHDDEIGRGALLAVARAALGAPEIDFWYTDRDIVTGLGEYRIHPFFKPDWSPEMLLSANYLTHFNVFRRELLDRIGGWDPATDGAQDWDIFIRIAEITTRIRRVPGIFYHWRMIEGSSSTNVMAKPYVPAAQRRVVQGHLDRRGLAAVAEPHAKSGFHIAWSSPPPSALVLVLDPQGSAGAERCAAVAAMVEPGVAEASIAVAPIAGAAPAASMRTALAESQAEYVLVLSTAIERLSDDFLREQVGWLANIAEIAFVTALSFDPGGRVVEAGLVVDAAGHGHPLLRGEPMVCSSYLGSPSWYRNVRAASPLAVSFRRTELLAALDEVPENNEVQDWFVALCRAVGEGRGRRGLVNPHSLAWLRAEASPPLPPFDPSVGTDPYFHPALGSVVPLSLGG